MWSSLCSLSGRVFFFLWGWGGDMFDGFVGFYRVFRVFFGVS